MNDNTTRANSNGAADWHHVLVPCVEGNRKLSWVGPTPEDRTRLYRKSIEDNDAFWARIAKQDFYWHTLWPDDHHVKSYNFHRSKGPVFAKWFEGAQTNMCYNALDRHLPKSADRVCFYWEGNDPSRKAVVTYGEMYTEVVQIANILKNQYGIVKGDCVAMYLPMIPFAAAVMLACARIGAVVSVVFAGFSHQALSLRIIEGKAKLLVTADASSRALKDVPLKNIVDQAIEDSTQAGVKLHCLVYENAGRDCCSMTPGRDTWYTDAVARLSPAERAECPIVWVGAEDPLFLLYTSGSTGKPKALVHTTAGYMVYAATTFKYVFDYHRDDVFFCTADIGWITGHSYVVYGPMVHCATSVLFEGVPTHPTPSRWWELVEQYKITIFYTAPTAIRSLMQAGNEAVNKCDRSTLRILGSVGEPINVEAWRWFHEVVGEGHADVVDTWWQTETGGHMITPLPGCTVQKPGSASLPFFGVEPVILDPMTLNEVPGVAEGLLAICSPWPGMARTIYNDHERYEQTYFHRDGYYLTGDGVRRDEDGYFWITGRVDDVLNVSGHRISTSEIEDAIDTHPLVVESAVVGVPHDIKGECIYAFVVFADHLVVTEKLLNEVKGTVREIIGPLATPDFVHPAQCGLPKTRSGKIVRRMLRKIATGNFDDIGDTSTLVSSNVIASLLESKNGFLRG